MKLKSLFFASVVAAAIKKQALSDAEIVETLLKSPWLRPPPTHEALTARFASLRKRQFDLGQIDLQGMLSDMTINPPGAPNSTVSGVQEMPAVSGEGAKRVKIRYGPYNMPPISQKNHLFEKRHLRGMSEYFEFSVKKPCDGDCQVLALFADLEFADGTKATNKDGTWLHHSVLINTGPEVQPLACDGGKDFDIMFMSGNEKTISSYASPSSSIKSGYRLAPENDLSLNTQLMNMKDKEQWVWLTLTYEFLPGKHPDFKKGRTVWMDIGQLPGCSRIKANWGPSNLTAQQVPLSTKFSEHSKLWKVATDGLLLGTGAHQHDGGTSTLIFHNGKVICDSKAMYSNSSAGHHGGIGGMRKRQMMSGSNSNNDIPHIYKQTGCDFKDGYPLKKGDTLYLQADYDFELHPGMKNSKGELDEVMGIVGSLVIF